MPESPTTTPSLNGVLPPITTPFDAAGELDLAALAANIERYNDAGLAGYLAFGSNGEAVHLDADERRKVLETLREKAAPGHTLVAGINELSARAARRSLAEAADAGADVALVITPYFYKSGMTSDVLRAYFEEVADTSPLPILIYNVPQNTGVVIDSATIALLAVHERIVGVKDSSGNLGALAETIRLTPPDFQVLVGNAGILYPAILMGAVGAILAVACVAPEASVAVLKAAKAGDHERARGLQERLSPLARWVTTDLGIAGLKASLDLAGYRGGVPRSPLRPLTDENRGLLAAAMHESDFFPHE